MRSLFLATLLVSSILILSGCSLRNPFVGLASNKEKEIAALKAEYNEKLAAAQAAHDQAVKKVISSKDAQMAGAANSFYGINYTFKTIPAPIRTDLIFNNLALEGWSAIGNIMPDFATMQKIEERLRKDLDETRTSLADLQKSHQQALAENQALATQAQKHLEELAAVEAARAKEEREFQSKLAAKQGELIEIQKLLDQKKDELANEKKARQAQIAKLSWGAGIIAALCVAGAIWSPVSKKELIIAAATFGGAAVALPFVEMWHVMVGLGTVVVSVFGYVLYKYRKEERVSDALVLANEDIKEKDPDLWKNKVAPVVEDRLKTYKKKAGKLVPEKDPSIEAHIDAKLAEFDALGRSPLSPPTPSTTK